MDYNREKIVELHVMEVAFALVTRELMHDNSEGLYEFLRRENTEERRKIYESKGLKFDEEYNKKKIDKYISNYAKNREKMIKTLNSMNYDTFEDNLSDKDSLNYYMNILNDFINKIHDELDGKLGESDTIIVDGKFSDD